MAFTKIAAAGIGSTGTVTLQNLNVTGIITATSFIGDISQATGAAAGLGTALSQDQSNPLNKVYFTDTILSIGSTTTVNPPSSSNIAYTQYAEIAVEEGYDLIVEDGDDLVPDILGLSTGTAAPLAGAGGRVRADNFTNKAGTGAPTFPNGINVIGVLTGDVTGTATTATNLADAANITTGTISNDRLPATITKNLTGDVTGNVNAGVITATSSIVVGNSFVKATSIGIGTTTTAGRNAGVGTAVGTLVYNTTTKGIEVYDGTGWITGLQSFFATGGTLDTTTRSGYTIHTFTTPDSFVIGGTSPKVVEVLVVAGGGGGPKGTGTGGSGAGGLLYSNSVSFAPGTYTIQVGGGGAGAVADNSLGTVGTPSFITNPGISSITAIGGGTGSRNGETGSPGGSGGGAGGASINGSNRPQTTGSQGPSGGLTGYGNPGGTTTGVGEYAGSGGGGAGAAGGPGGNPGGGAGGNGLSYSINGSNTTYAGGGGGGHESDSTNVPAASGLGGTGGGGNGGILRGSNPRLPTSGSANRGGGAGGNGGNQTAGSGGSGIVIIAYPTS